MHQGPGAVGHIHPVPVEVASFMGEHSHHGEGTPANCCSSSSMGQAVGGQECKVLLRQCSYSGKNKLREEQGREGYASNAKHVLFPGLVLISLGWRMMQQMRYPGIMP